MDHLQLDPLSCLGFPESDVLHRPNSQPVAVLGSAGTAPKSKPLIPKPTIYPKRRAVEFPQRGVGWFKKVEIVLRGYGRSYKWQSPLLEPNVVSYITIIVAPIEIAELSLAQHHTDGRSNPDFPSDLMLCCDVRDHSCSQNVLILIRTRMPSPLKGDKMSCAWAGRSAPSPAYPSTHSSQTIMATDSTASATPP